MFTSETVLVLSRDEIFVDLLIKTEIPGLLRLGRLTRLAGKKLLGRCPCQASV